MDYASPKKKHFERYNFLHLPSDERIQGTHLEGLIARLWARAFISDDGSKQAVS